MAGITELIHDTINGKGILDDYTLKLQDNDRVKVEINGEYITYMRVIDGKFSYLGHEGIEII